MKTRFNVKVVVLFLVLFVMAGSAFADPYVNYPGTRARGMAGAFTAVADDGSAMWYNPAGLAFEGTDVILEYSDSVEWDKNKSRLSDGDSSYFLAGRFKGGWGVSFYEPYKTSYGINFVDNGNTYTGLVSSDVNQLSAGKGFSLGSNGNFKLGFTIDMTYITLDDSQSYMFKNGITADYVVEDDSAIGLAASLGAMYVIPIESKGMNIKLGATYHSKSSSTSNDTYSNEPDFFVERPSSWDIGASFSKSFAAFPSALLLSVQYGETDYGSMGDLAEDLTWEKTSFGVEYVISKQILFMKNLAFRAGVYESDMAEWSAPHVKGKSFGIGTLIGDHFGLDLTKETREFDWPSYHYWSGQEDLDLISLAATWTF